MSNDERIRWCIQRAEEIEAELPPQDDPNVWSSPRMCALFWRDMAAATGKAGGFA